MAVDGNQNGFEKASALAEAFRAVRGELPGAADFDDDLSQDDISQSINGNRAVTGKAVWSANSAAHFARDSADQKHQQEQKQEADEAQELAHLAAWNAQMTTLGGVSMTNEEAQTARKYIIDHDDEYARRAVREGRIREDETEEYKRSIRRMYELEDKRGRGTMTPEEERECERLRQSRAGNEAERDAGQHFAETKDHTIAADAKADQSAAAMRDTNPSVADNTLFQSAPPLDQHFAAAKAAETPLDKKPEPAPVPAGPAPRVAAMGVSV